MMPVTFVVGIVLALALGVVLTLLWSRARSAADEARVASADARSASDATKPLADTLSRIEAQMRDFEAQRQHMMGGLDARLASLGRETVSLSQALRGPNSRGRWGELTLRRVAELSGMSPHCDFSEQVSENSKRPDMLVKLPGNRTIAVDAKAPLSGYLDAESAVDAAAKNAALDRHVQQLARHVAELASREYWTQFPAQSTPEMVVLFLAGEHFLSAALERRPDLLDVALAKRVLIATPVTLVSVLKGVAYGWQQERLAKNAEELRRIAGEFHERVRVFGDLYAESGRYLGRAVEAYNKSASSWDSRLLPSVRKMRDLGVGGSAEVVGPQHIDVAPRPPQMADRVQDPTIELPQ
ncbi:MAG: DNA recombination protein RmuC [Acidobacteriota bacterium]